MIFAMAKGLILPSIDGTGLAFPNLDLDAKAPTQVCDTLYVHCEVSRPVRPPRTIAASCEPATW